MNRRKNRTPRAALVAVAAAALAAGSLAPSTMALWSNTADTTLATPKLARAFFGANINGGTESTISDLSNAANQKRTVSTTDAIDQMLLDNKEVAVPIRVRTMAQGNNGLKYTTSVTKPAANTLWGIADVKVFPVATAADCTVAAAPAASALPVQSPWQPAYKTTTTVDEDYWCLVATADIQDGFYANVGTVEATSTIDGDKALDRSTWGTTIQSGITATTNSPSLTVTFDPEITRPGGTP